jgi:hypothetical protein
LSKWRGELLFQLQTAAVVLAQRSYSEGRITKFQAQVFNIKYSEDRIAFNNKVKLETKICNVTTVKKIEPQT